MTNGEQLELIHGEPILCNADVFREIYYNAIDWGRTL